MKTWRIDTPSQTMVFAKKGASLPFVCYWDAALPSDEDLYSLALSTEYDITGGMLDDVPEISLCPHAGTTFQGQFGGIFRKQNGRSIQPKFNDITAQQSDDKLSFTCTDEAIGLTLIFEILSYPDTDMLALKTRLVSEKPIFVNWLSAPVLPASQHSDHSIEISGRWCGEFQMNEIPWTQGARLRQTQSGRTGHETFPGLIVPKTQTTNIQGGVFAFHYAWSGGHKMITEELSDGRRQVQFGHAEDIDIELVTETETAPLLVSYSSNGLNGVAQNFQRHTRANILPFKASERPRLVHYNCWEAIYFDHNLEDLKEIADIACELGAERFVLDDGWFGRRDDDTNSLGDWHIDKTKFPDGLMPLISHINQLGLEFGLWFEPEMINPDSELYQLHPDWILSDENQLLGRNQMVLDMRKTEVRDYLFERIDAILSDHKITYVKWDHNRVLPYPLAAQTDGFYDLLKRLRSAHPDVEFESCSAGGGRIDLGVLQHCQRVWLSDSNDAIERWKMQHNAALWLPADVVGSHVGPRKCHTSGRVLPMSFRAYVAASRHMGFEMDPRELTEDETKILKDVTQWYRQNRDWMHQGCVNRLEQSDPAVLSEICVSDQTDRFVAFIGQITTSDPVFARPQRLTGLNEDSFYEVKLRNPEDAARQSKGPIALRDKTLKLSGKSLMQDGLRLPAAFPATMWVVEGQEVK